MDIFDPKNYAEYLKKTYYSPFDRFRRREREQYVERFGYQKIEEIVKNTEEFCRFLIKHFENSDKNWHRFRISESDYISTGLALGHHPDMLLRLDEFDKQISHYLLTKALDTNLPLGFTEIEFFNAREDAGHIEIINYLEIQMDKQKLSNLKMKLEKDKTPKEQFEREM